MIKCLGVLAALAAAVLPVAAQAGSGRAPGLPRWESRLQVEERAHMQKIRIYAACMAQRRPAEVAALLETPIGSRDQRRHLNDLVGRGECIEGAIAIRELGLRGAFAERLVNLADPPPELRRDAPPDGDFASYRAAAAAASGRRLRAEGEALVHALWAARCAVRQSPSAVLELLRTEAASREELAALRNLTPVIAGCAAAPGAITVDRHAMRESLAEAAYALLVPRD